MDISNPFVKLDFFEVDQGRWPDFEKLFERRGGPKNCWCMVWRGKPEDRKTKVTKKAAIRNMVQEHVPVGYLGICGRRACSMVLHRSALDLSPDSPSYRFMGFVPQFKEFSFVEVGTAGSRRHVMRFMLDSFTDFPVSP